MPRTVPLAVVVLMSLATTATADPPVREVVPGVSTNRIIPGEPFALQGKRIVFTNWYYIQPGDLDWIDAEGKSVYVDGNSEVDEAIFVGKRAPFGIRIAAQKPTVIGPMEMPYRCILQEGGIYKGWTSTEYMESSDALHWEVKALLEVDELITDGIQHVFIDPSAPPEARYKSVWTTDISQAEFDAFRAKRPDAWEPRALLHVQENQRVSCLRGAVSPDGIRWTTLPDPVSVEYADTQNIAYYDTALQQYVLYTRQWSAGERARSIPSDIRNSWTGIGRRAIGRSATNDFSAFPVSEMILEPTPDMPPSEQIYTNCYTTVPGAPDQHLMFPVIWNASRTDTTRIVMASSHDGAIWHWVPDGDILQTQPFGQWNGGCIWSLPNLIEMPNGDWALPYLAHNVPHKYPRGKRVGGIGYAVWPKGRMVALEAKEDGEFTMIPLIPPGNTIQVNAITERSGWIKIEIVGKDGRTLADCDPLMGDLDWTTVTWQGDAATDLEPGQPATIRVVMHQAQLFGIQFE